MRRSVVSMIILLAWCALPAAADDAVEKVREGIRQFRQGNMESAEKAFAEADLARPDNDIITFNRACVFDVMGDQDKAIDLFQKASLSREGDLAATARYNLGCLAATRAREIFGEAPENATPEIREEGLQHLMRAVKHFRDCIALDKNHENARYNVELIRLWIKHMTALWKEKDRQKAREEMDLLKFLEMLESRQLTLRSLTRALAQEKDSPKGRQALSEAEDEQRALAEEIDPLKEKIDQSVAGQEQGLDPADLEKFQQKVATIREWADEVWEFMEEAADLIPDTPEEAHPPQTQALDGLDRIFREFAPFPKLLNKAAQAQKGLVDQTIPLVENPEDVIDEEGVDFETMAWLQNRVAGWSDYMVPKAQQALKELEGMDPGQAFQGADPEEAKKQMEGMKKGMEKAIELCPRISTLTREAAEALRDKDPATALPNEEEALKLLREIAEDMPKDPNEQSAFDSEDQKEEEGQDQQQQQDQSSRQDEEQQQRELSQREAEAILQKAKERERKHKEEMERRRRALGRPGKVEKDW